MLMIYRNPTPVSEPVRVRAGDPHAGAGRLYCQGPLRQMNWVVPLYWVVLPSK